MAILNFDANQVPPEEQLEALPAGWYNVQIVGSEIKPTAKGGAYLQLDLQVLDGPYAGRRIFDRLNIQNENPTAVEIAYRRLSAYCHAVGVLKVEDSQQLHGIPLKVRVTVRTDPSGQYAPSNEVRAVKNINENVGDPSTPQAPAQTPPWQVPAQNQPAPQQAPAGPAAQVQGNTPPWLQQANPPAASQDQGKPTKAPPWAQG
ncbi:MAG: hypothetical protein DIU71_19155 [Proteobacteria bacterium]|nr:MAG: hypothetical protein DIU71_19155 [Pseudomonadota bacterium]